MHLQSNQAYYRTQVDIASQALMRFFGTSFPLELTDGGMVTFKGIAPRTLNLRDCLDFLSKNTGRRKPINPFFDPDMSAWFITTNVVGNLGFYSAAYEIISACLDDYLELQLRYHTRIHKGSPLFFKSQRLAQLNENESALGCMLLAFIEDCVLTPEPYGLGAYQQLTITFGFSARHLSYLQKFVKEVARDSSYYPEEILADWETRSLPVRRLRKELPK